MRVRSHWFREGATREPEDIAQAAAFIIWRIAADALKRMRAADFEIDAGPAYFRFIAEFLAFLTALADRMAYRKLEADERARFTQALGARLANIIAENEADLLGQGSAGAFIDLANARGDDYASFDFADTGPDFALLRCFATHVADTLPARDQPWVHAQVMEILAPEAAETLDTALLDLVGLGPPKRRQQAGSAGD